MEYCEALGMIHYHPWFLNVDIFNLILCKSQFSRPFCFSFLCQMDTLCCIMWFYFHNFRCFKVSFFSQKLFSGADTFLVPYTTVPSPPPAHLELHKCTLLHRGTGELPSAVIADLPQFQSVINRYGFAAQQQHREIANPLRICFRRANPSDGLQ